MKVFVYFNLHKKVWSVKALEGHNKGRVIAHADKVLLRDVTFKVSEAGRQRVLREKRKNVHAGVVGTLEAMLGETTTAWADQHIWLDWAWSENWTKLDRAYEKYARVRGPEVTYNPYKYTSFVYKETGAPITVAPMAYLGRKCVHVFDPCEMEETN